MVPGGADDGPYYQGFNLILAFLRIIGRDFSQNLRTLFQDMSRVLQTFRSILNFKVLKPLVPEAKLPEDGPMPVLINFSISASSCLSRLTRSSDDSVANFFFG